MLVSLHNRRRATERETCQVRAELNLLFPLPFVTVCADKVCEARLVFPFQCRVDIAQG